MATVSTVEHDAVAGAPPSEGGGRSWQGALAVAIAVGAVLAVLIWWTAVNRGTSEVRVEIPSGTAQAIADGDAPEVVDGEIVLDRGDELVVVNRDDRPHIFGSLTIAPGATARQVYAEAGRFTGPTSVTTDGTLTILVR